MAVAVPPELDRTSSTALCPPGTRYEQGNNAYVYCRAGEQLQANRVVGLRNDDEDVYTETFMTNSPNATGFGVTLTLVPDDDYYWAQVRGTVDVRMGETVTRGEALMTGTDDGELYGRDSTSDVDNPMFAFAVENGTANNNSLVYIPG